MKYLDVILDQSDCRYRYTACTPAWPYFFELTFSLQRAVGMAPMRSSAYGLASIWFFLHNIPMSWTVLFHDEFDREYQTLAKGLQDELLAHALLLSQFGPGSGGPR